MIGTKQQRRNTAAAVAVAAKRFTRFAEDERLPPRARDAATATSGNISIAIFLLVVVLVVVVVLITFTANLCFMYGLNQLL
mmetsp:Transcript_21840/g.51976  ORF Transcript_21840/g.51976 Transcript_21840/m.51976 type:complete len:81 (-) Transcript_21840:60-302(-)